ncbi:MAG TPA: PEP-CTERM sorting domain-containing protein [Kiritimatiellia bacterium]|nr:PEP-CTERM sorting domain-containing protein [Kiritimatiellia bacterium]
MNAIRWMLVPALCSALALPPARADLIWQEDFSDVSDWSVIFNFQGDGSSLDSDGSLGTFSVAALNNEVAFGPTVGVAPFVPFDPANKADYTMTYVVEGLTASVSYDIRLDLFDSGDAYIATVFAVVPQGVGTGSNTVNLGDFTFDGATAKILPKVSVFTGPDFTDQEVRFDEIRFDVVPEPSVAALMLAGALLAARGVRRRRDYVAVAG